MSRIDELQRLHDAAMALGSCGLDAYEFGGAARRNWPAIHRVLVAARKVAGDGGLLFIYELEQELRALDGGLPADQ